MDAEEILKKTEHTEKTRFESCVRSIECGGTSTYVNGSAVCPLATGVPMYVLFAPTLYNTLIGRCFRL